jgi:hypothetical protein
MPPGTYTVYINELLELAKTLYASTNDVSLEYLKGIFNEIETSPAIPEKIIRLKEELDQLDSRRNTNWKETFPWLVDL